MITFTIVCTIFFGLRVFIRIVRAFFNDSYDEEALSNFRYLIFDILVLIWGLIILQ